ncbi:dTDP-4-amino-4,6-dideoxygalactose transaminase [Flavobacterium arsenatis]|uniref:dTDP-4-amino-4,6-dideoxygalactose transaminase n=1 Tax=Flavobacterium arsenatis TaxID=1484332 RepID=A0ABU1TME5_9FLAO|nr:DegT/DnrJ/EryC1/StrS family aminotransferase [Flavobacterium arsenatis]MDR6966987.1 dTDP-4-amino-4,6-dideoxygalactose transaminase [Flavobacterium arsenatis]
MIPVTKCFLPPIEEYTEWVQKAYDKQWLTNRGDLVKLLEEQLKGYLGVDWMTITNNGTVPLQIALKLLGKGGEIITTPFSYVATTASIVWENCTPVFVDIHPEYLTIDETKIEAAITDKTTCILATHVFGNPCAVEAIEVIAKKHNLYVIYDAAHSFGVKYNGQSIFNFGDVSTCSFHATKLFHTGEGGAMFANDPELRHQLFYSHNFGHKGALDFYGLGINGKISELHAAMGLAVFPFMDQIIDARKKAVESYDRLLDFSTLQKMKIREHTDWNYSYYPVVFESEEQVLEAQKRLNENDIFPRRYFCPSLNTITYIVSKEMPVSENISNRILCLPLYVGIENQNIEEICRLINQIV